VPGPSLLRTERLTRAYGSLLAVNGVDFSVEEGELRSLIGRNGAGKTTFFRLISGEVEPTSGRIWFREHEVLVTPTAS
jgi:ABC-type branched-subunit amino acid transport system ATPase component